jgi:sugar (pentulose or hexulose) kinase
VIAGMMDVAATTLGTGAIRPGQACSIVGTSFLNCFLLDKPGFEPRGVGVQMRTTNSVWLRAMVNTAGTINLDWFLDQLCAAERADPKLAGSDIYRWAEAQAASVPVGANGLLYHPYLSNAGVISPFFHPAARAQFFGLSVDHTRAHMLRAVYEGVALSMRDCVTAIPDAIDEWFMAGGGSRSGFWCQMFADCTGKTILVPEGEEFGARGVAMLAGVATGIYADVADAARTVSRVRRRFEPDPGLTERYARLHDIYKGVHRHLREDWWDRFNMMNEFDEAAAKPRMT